MNQSFNFCNCLSFASSLCHRVKLSSYVSKICKKSLLANLKFYKINFLIILKNKFFFTTLLMSPMTTQIWFTTTCNDPTSLLLSKQNWQKSDVKTENDINLTDLSSIVCSTSFWHKLAVLRHNQLANDEWNHLMRKKCVNKLKIIAHIYLVPK